MKLNNQLDFGPNFWTSNLKNLVLNYLKNTFKIHLRHIKDIQSCQTKVHRNQIFSIKKHMLAPQ